MDPKPTLLILALLAIVACSDDPPHDPNAGPLCTDLEGVEISIYTVESMRHDGHNHDYGREQRCTAERTFTREDGSLGVECTRYESVPVAPTLIDIQPCKPHVPAPGTFMFADCPPEL